MTTDERSREELRAENEELRYRLEEAEETLEAIRSGAVDALVVSRPEGEQIFTLQGAEHAYRLLVENMNEGAATLAADGTILYCNRRLATMLEVPLEKLIGAPLGPYLASPKYPLLAARPAEKYPSEPDRVEIVVRTGAGDAVPALISLCAIELSGSPGTGVVLTDLRALKEAEKRVHEAELHAQIAAEHELAQEEIVKLNEELRKNVAELSVANTLLRDSRLAALNMMEDALVARRQAEETSCELRATNDELERFNNVSVGRELRMIELKKEINALCARIGEPPPYPLEFEEG